MTEPDTAASDVPDLGKPFCTRCHKWGHRYTECPEPAEAADPTDIAATDLGHLARRFVSLTVTRQHAILDELVGPLAWDDTATFQQRIDLMRQVKERGLVGRLAEMVDTR